MIGVGSPHSFRPRDLLAVNTDVEELVDKVAWNQFFQRQHIPEDLLDHNARKFFTTMMRRDYFSADFLKTLPEHAPERKMDLPAMLAKSDLPGEVILSDDALAYFVDTFETTGFSGGINWYRAMGKTWEEIGKRKQTWEVNIPFLYIWPEQDPIIRPGAEAGMEDYIADLEKITILDCGHSVMEDKPQQLSNAIVGWLNRKFPRTH